MLNSLLIVLDGFFSFVETFLANPIDIVKSNIFYLPETSNDNFEINRSLL